jgi:hypothetical protein
MNALRNLTMAALFAAACTFAPVIAAQDKPAASQGAAAIDDVDCRTLLRLGGEERGFTLIYFHGYVSGKRGQTKLSPQDLSEATDRIVDQCIDKPGEKLLAVFERARPK